MKQLSKRELTLREQILLDLISYAAGCLEIRTKSGEVTPFILNRIQRQLHKASTLR